MDNDALIEVMARAITDAENGGEYSNHLIAQAVLVAIQQSGTHAVVPALSEVKDDMLMDAQQAFNDAVQLQQRGLSEWTIRMQAAINVLSKKPD